MRADAAGRPRAALADLTRDEIAAARKRIAGTVLRTPLVQLPLDRPGRIFLKLESLQPIGSFKLRGATNAMRCIVENDAAGLAHGVYTASAGNMAQGVAWSARALGIPCTVIVPDTAPQTKLAAIHRLGATIEKRPFDDWWQVIVEHGDPARPDRFVHPFADRDVLAGNATIASEIREDLAGVDEILVPYGGGGLACGIAMGARLEWPADTPRVIACEVETAAPLRAARAAGAPVATAFTASFVDGIGSRRVSDEMWPLARDLLDDVVAVPLDDVARAVRTLVERARVVAEGAGATAVAAALDRTAEDRTIVAIVSGGNIDVERLLTILGPASASPPSPAAPAAPAARAAPTET